MIIMQIWSVIEFIKENFYLLTHPINFLYSGVVYLCRLYFFSSIGGWSKDKHHTCAQISYLPVEFWTEHTDFCNNLLESHINHISVWLSITAILVAVLARPMEITTTLVWIAHPFFSGNSTVAHTVSAHAVPEATVTTTATRRQSTYNPQSAITRKINEATKKRNEALFQIFGSFLSVLKSARLGKAGSQLLLDFDAKYQEEITNCQKRLQEITTSPRLSKSEAKNNSDDSS